MAGDFVTIIVLFFEMFMQLFYNYYLLTLYISMVIAYGLISHKAGYELWLIIFVPLILLFTGFIVTTDFIMLDSIYRLSLAGIMTLLIVYGFTRLLSMNK